MGSGSGTPTVTVIISKSVKSSVFAWSYNEYTVFLYLKRYTSVSQLHLNGRKIDGCDTLHGVITLYYMASLVGSLPYQNSRVLPGVLETWKLAYYRCVTERNNRKTPNLSIYWLKKKLINPSYSLWLENG